MIGSLFWNCWLVEQKDAFVCVLEVCSLCLYVCATDTTSAGRNDVERLYVNTVGVRARSDSLLMLFQCKSLCNNSTDFLVYLSTTENKSNRFS